MILSRAEIQHQIAEGGITIEPYVPEQVSFHGYDYRLGDEICETKPVSAESDMEMEHTSRIPQSGLTLQPGCLYLATTFEVIGSRQYVVLLSGRTATARRGLFVQLSANLGNLGGAHRWTLELACVQPVIVYSGMLVGRVSFWKPLGKVTYYSGPYAQFSRPIGNLRKL